MRVCACMSSLCACISSTYVGLQGREKCETCAAAGSHTPRTIAPFLLHQRAGERASERSVEREDVWLVESATVLSRQEGNNGSAVLLVCLAAFMQHFSEGHRRLLAPRALLTRPLPAGH